LTPASTGHTHLHREQAATPLDTKRSSIGARRGAAGGCPDAEIWRRRRKIKLPVPPTSGLSNRGRAWPIDDTYEMTDPQITNIRVMRPTRPKLRGGDLFVVNPADGLYVFGRVIEADLPRQRAPMPGAALIYVYRFGSASTEPPWSELRPNALLLPPMFINRMPWTRGYFLNVGHQPLQDSDLLERHCFRRWNGTYVDRDGALLDREYQPCGDWGLASFRVFDDALSQALGIPLVPPD